jgi:single-strand DNA-binding protein
MAQSVNSITLVGRLGKEPEMRYTQSGQAVCSFSVATDRSWTDTAGQKQTRTTWFQVTSWGKLAETCNNYLKKGRLVYIEGRVEPIHQWTDNEGAKHTSNNIDVTANSVVFLSSANGNGNGEAASETPAEEETEEIPF